MWMDTMYLQGEILEDDCIQHLLRTLPSFIPDYDREYGNGYWLSESRHSGGAR